MQDELLPLFPLQLVLLPRMVLPLHIFEERYKEMMSEVLTSGGEFGVLQATANGVVNTGCTATVEQVIRRYPDGRMDLLAVGRRRFEVFTLNDDRSFLRGTAQFFDDEDPVPADEQLRAKAALIYEAARKAAPSLELEELDMDDDQLSFQIARSIADLTVKQVLLSSKSENDRLRRIIETLPVELQRQQQSLHIREVAPKNGHGKHHVELE